MHTKITNKEFKCKNSNAFTKILIERNLITIFLTWINLNDVCPKA